jgi:cytochrome c-type biogenesis protein CcmH
VRLLVAALAAFALLAQPALAVSLPDIEDEVMCVECGTALNVSEAPSADRERAFIRRRIAEGMDKQEVLDAMVAEYGRSVLATPDNRGFQAANWLVPVVLALFAGRVEDDAPRLAPEDASRLERDMAGYDL